MWRRWTRLSLARRLLGGACGLLLVALVVYLLGQLGLLGSVGLEIDDQGEGTHARVGEKIYAAVPLQANGGGTVRLISATVTGVPAGLQVIQVGAQLPDTHMHMPRIIGMDAEGSVRTKFPLLVVHPVSAVAISADGRPAPWSLLVVIEATRSGTYQTGGIEVRARNGWRVATTRARFTIGLIVQDNAQRPDMSRPLQLLQDCPGSEAPTPPTWDAVVRRAVTAGGGEAVVTVGQRPARTVWNTIDGSRPSQAQVDGGLTPSIYGEQELIIDHVIAGQLVAGEVVGLILGGAIGDDHDGGCSLALDEPGPGQRLLAVFGTRLPFDQRVGQPVIEVRDLALITGSTADTPYGPVAVPQ